MFEMVFDGFENTGREPHGWVLSWKEMEAKIKKMERFVRATAALHREIEKGLKKPLQCNEHKKDYILKQQKVIDSQHTYLKKKSLNRSFDTITSLLARTIFTILSRIKLVFHRNHSYNYPPSIPRGFSASTTVYPSSGPSVPSSKHQENNHLRHGFFETNSKILKPSSTTLGAAALALHYAKLITETERMIRWPRLVRVDARDNIYSMLPSSIRASVRWRLKGKVFTASDPNHVSELREALGKILGWLSPLAHNMVEWQSKRSHQNLTPKTGVFLLQTLFYADQQKTEAAITELLVGLNYIWRFEREMNAKALLNCTNLKNNMQQQHQQQHTN